MIPPGPPRQPWLHTLFVAVQAPTVAVGGADGQIRADGAQGVLHGDVRVLSLAELRVGGVEPEPVAGGLDGANRARFTGLLPLLGDSGPDPVVRVERVRSVAAGLVTEQISVVSHARRPVSAEVVLDVAADLALIDGIKSGRPVPAPDPRSTAGADTVRWAGNGVAVELRAQGARIAASDTERAARLSWLVDLPAPGRQVLCWHLRADAEGAGLLGVDTGPRWRSARVDCADRRLSALFERSLADLAALRMRPADSPDDVFLAAGAPWFVTLFGRDSLWAARLMLPLDTGLAAGTLRALAARQGRRVDVDTAEAPGKIPHELRGTRTFHGGGTGPGWLPPLYYGSVDATPLWVCLLHDAWRWGMPGPEVRALLPAMAAALEWMVEHGDPDADGFLEYVDTSGHGLANQGWKDSGDAIRFADGRQASPPVALCEVQGYAYEAAVHGADLLDAFGLPGADRWRAWARELAERFRDRFWVSDGVGRYPALALDADKKPVDALTSNIGHLLGTGILDAAEAELVADRVTGPELSSGFGLRTMSSRAGGFSPLSYHCGSVWPHDTAIVVRGLATCGFTDRAVGLIDGLLAASTHFAGRLPELFGGDAQEVTGWPVPYPAACRPQAWSAAAAVALVQALLGMDADVPGGRLRLRPVRSSQFGGLSVDGLVAGTERFGLDVAADGTVRANPGLTLHLDT